MLHSQARSTNFRRRTQYWDHKNKKYARRKKPYLIHTFTELSTIQEEPDITLPIHEEPGTARKPKRLPNPPPVTVGRVTTRHPSTTVEGKLPRNTFYRRHDGKIALEDGLQRLDVTKERQFALLKEKSEVDNCIINVKEKEKKKKERERMSRGINVRARATQIIRSQSDEKIFTKKSLGTKKPKNIENIEDNAVSNDEKLDKMSDFPACRTSYDIEYPVNFDGSGIGNRPPIVKSDDSEHIFLKRKKKPKMKSKQSEARDADTPGLDYDNFYKVTGVPANEKTQPEISSPGGEKPVTGNHGIIVTDHGPPVRPIVIAADQYAQEFNRRAHKLKKQKHLMPQSLKSVVRAINIEADWKFLWEGTKKCLQVAWEGVQCQSHAVMKRIEQTRKAFMDDPIKRANEELLNSDRSNMASEVEAGRECVYFRRETQPGFITRV